MLDHALSLGRIGGIEIRIHWSWLIIFILLTWSLALFFFPVLFPTIPLTTSWIISAISSVLLFVSVLVHEMSHSLVAKAEGIPVSSITLFVFGGVSNIEREPPTAQDEFLMAAAGPAASLVIGVICFALFSLLGSIASIPILGILFALAFYNVTLAVFNLIPGFPLDGGRIFRAIVWAITGSLREATNIATAVGHLFAYIFIFGGLLLALTGEFLSGIWLVFIGWFLNNAASMSNQQVQIESRLRGVHVSAAMQPPPAAIPAATSVFDYVENFVLARNLRALPVVEPSGQLVGLVTLSDARQVPRNAWQSTTVGQIMRPIGQLALAQPDEQLIQALQDMSRSDVNQLPVIQQGRLVGLLTRGDVMRYLQIREEIGQHAA